MSCNRYFLSHDEDDFDDYYTPIEFNVERQLEQAIIQRDFNKVVDLVVNQQEPVNLLARFGQNEQTILDFTLSQGISIRDNPDIYLFLYEMYVRL